MHVPVQRYRFFRHELVAQLADGGLNTMGVTTSTPCSGFCWFGSRLFRCTERNSPGIRLRASPGQIVWWPPLFLVSFVCEPVRPGQGSTPTILTRPR